MKKSWLSITRSKPDKLVTHHPCPMNVPVYNAFKLTDNSPVANDSMPYIKSLYSCLNRIRGDGYTGSFEPIGNVLQEIKTGRIYQIDQLELISFIRFEGNSNPDANVVVMYVIKTNDGLKGTYINLKSTVNQHNFENLLTTDKRKV